MERITGHILFPYTQASCLDGEKERDLIILNKTTCASLVLRIVSVNSEEALVLQNNGWRCRKQQEIATRNSYLPIHRDSKNKPIIDDLTRGRTWNLLISNWVVVKRLAIGPLGQLYWLLMEEDQIIQLSLVHNLLQLTVAQGSGKSDYS
jgi:hypothetical protein